MLWAAWRSAALRFHRNSGTSHPWTCRKPPTQPSGIPLWHSVRKFSAIHGKTLWTTLCTALSMFLLGMSRWYKQHSSTVCCHCFSIHLHTLSCQSKAELFGKIIGRHYSYSIHPYEHCTCVCPGQVTVFVSDIFRNHVRHFRFAEPHVWLAMCGHIHKI